MKPHNDVFCQSHYSSCGVTHVPRRKPRVKFTGHWDSLNRLTPCSSKRFDTHRLTETWSECPVTSQCWHFKRSSFELDLITGKKWRSVPLPGNSVQTNYSVTFLTLSFCAFLSFRLYIWAGWMRRNKILFRTECTHQSFLPWGVRLSSNSPHLQWVLLHHLLHKEPFSFNSWLLYDFIFSICTQYLFYFGQLWLKKKTPTITKTHSTPVETFLECSSLHWRIVEGKLDPEMHISSLI